MRVAEISTVFLSLAVALGLTWSVTPVVWGDPDVCCPWPGFPDYGDGHHQHYPGNPCYIDENTQLSEDLYCEDLTILPGVTLDTCGYTVRVCGTLLNRGIITDSCTGGAGGPGGNHGDDDELGKGHDPYNHGDCNHQPYCTDGQDGELGDLSPLQPGQNGRGGRGGGGGGGGGGAWWTLHDWDADGGDGGIGGDGGKGGGYVKIYAFHFDNPSPGVIHADGLPGTDGSDGSEHCSDGEYCHCDCSEGSTEVCGPEHCVDTTPPRSDASGGGGGGGGGGAGGNGGTVEVYYGYLIHQGTIHANGGPIVADGGGGGADGCCNQYSLPVGGEGDGCPGGAPNGGSGGAGEHGSGCSEDGQDGGHGSGGANGTWSLTPWRRYCRIGPDCYWGDDINPDNPCEECDPDFSMTAWHPLPEGWPCDDGEWCFWPDECDGECHCIPGPDRCYPCGCYEDIDECQDEYLVGGQCYTDCDDPVGSGQGGVDMCLACGGGFNECTVTNPDGFWQIDGAPCFPQVSGGDCTATASHSHRMCCEVPPCPPMPCDSSIDIIVDKDHEAANQSLQHWCCCVYCDMDGNKMRTIIGDVPCFVDCVYYENCDCCNDCCLEAGDANCDEHLSIIWDVIPFVDCVYHGNCTPCAAWNCPEEGACGSSGTGQGADGFTIGGAVYSDESSPLFTGVEGIPVRVVSRDSVVLPVSTTTNWLGIWRIDNLAPGTYTVVFGQEKNKTVKAQNSIKIVVNEKNQAANQSIKFLRKP